jgi:hypothetical protein
MPDRIDGAVDRMQATGGDPPVDRVVAQPQPTELAAMDSAVLASGERSNRPVASSKFTFTGNNTVNVKLVGHRATMPLAGATNARRT